MKRKNSHNNLSLYLMIIVMVLIVVGIVVFNLFFQSITEWKSIVADLLTSLLSAIAVGLTVGTFTKIISDKIFKIEKNDKWLKSYGIDKIGGGRSTPKDTLELFGNHYKNFYPREVKLLFISGNGYFNFFKSDISRYLSAPNTLLKILLVNCDKENDEFRKRIEELCPQKETYKEQVLNQAIPTLKTILENAKCDPNKIQLRFYKDEYRYNFRIAKYVEGNTIETKCWWNIQPFNKDAVDLSIMLHGNCSNEAICDQNVIYSLDRGFDYLFEKYKDTQYDFSK